MSRHPLTPWFVLLLAVWLTPALCEQNVRPGINDHYQTPAFERWRQTFERPGREVYDRRAEVVTALGLAPGMAVADVGAGTGFYSLMFADAVGPQGQVYAVDIADYFINGTLARAREAGFDHLAGVINNPHSVELPTASVDLIFTSATYHHFEYPQSTLASMHQALRPNGELVIIDYRKDPAVASEWVLEHVRLDKQGVIREVEQAGFKYLDEPLQLREFFALRFRRD